MQENRSLTISYNSITELLNWFDDFLHKVHLSINPYLLVFEEVTINILKHGYLDKEGILEIKVDFDKDVLKLEFIDSAPPFNPILYKIDEKSGNGIKLIKIYSSEIYYERKGDRNILRLKMVTRSSPLPLA